ncbi:response regulator receiver protein [Rubidibacter lacunae KORDI 51-2]|uniref:Protein PatA n=1 Tax=Rubidibacter lacunae KORDI 51-2 TaxID=582515 RepID=U5DIF6_9CHRO|nr:response regulator [Rubidibacter lacunae]ERN40379.1 response regulator receiver protein [Rubidibacter lacunae KORDI 51-2]
MKALHEIVAKRQSGCVTLGDPKCGVSAWKIYVGAGKIHYATAAFGCEERLPYLLERFGIAVDFKQLAAAPSDYNFLCKLWRTEVLSLQQLRRLLYLVTQEALIHCAALPPVKIDISRRLGLDPILIALPLPDTIAPVRQSVGRWMQLHGDVESPLQRFHTREPQQLYHELLTYAAKDDDYIRTLLPALRQQQCLYSIARALRADPLAIASDLQPCIRSGAIDVLPYSATASAVNRPTIACIDDSHTVQRQVRLVLEAAGYRVLGLTDPARALSILARERPALVLMDITMPDISGYELCRLLRQSSLLSAVPIVMLTGRDGAIDRLRARMVGASDYLTKPFDPQRLLSLAKHSIASGGKDAP